MLTTLGENDVVEDADLLVVVDGIVMKQVA